MIDIGTTINLIIMILTAVSVCVQIATYIRMSNSDRRSSQDNDR